MKTKRLQASVRAQSLPRICARSGACLQAPDGTRQLADLPDEAVSISIQNAKMSCFRVCICAREQLARAWRNGMSLLSSAGTNAKACSVCAWKHTSALLSRLSTSARAQSSRAWKRIRAQQIARAQSKRLQLAETISLGEKRFVAVIKVDGREFLVGGGATNVALLAQLDPKKQLKARKSFDGILTEQIAVPKKQPAKRAKTKITTSPVEQAGGQL
jgi:hypothetical protein